MTVLIEHTCHDRIANGSSPAVATDLCARCQNLLDQPEPMPTEVTREQAEAWLRIVREVTGDDTAALYEPGFHGSSWVVALEGGPEDWPFIVTGHQAQTGNPPLVPGTWVEAMNSWSIGIYLA